MNDPATGEPQSGGDRLPALPGACGSWRDRRLNRVQQAPGDIIHANPFGLGPVIQQHPVPQHRIGEHANVFNRDVRATLQEGTGLCAEDEELTSPSPSTQLTHSLMKSGVPGWCGREAAANWTA